MITAEEYLVSQSVSKNKVIVMSSLSNGDYIVKRMVEFAKLHVEEALKQAYNNIEYTTEDSSVPYVIESSILNAYPLENIK